MLFVAANDLLTMFVALEVLLPAAVPDLRPGPPAPAALARRRRSSTSCWARSPRRSSCTASRWSTASAGSVDLRAHPRRHGRRRQRRRCSCSGLALLVVGLLFKASVAPFHIWTPDVYQGAPTPVTAFMAACTKVAAFGAHPAGALRRASARRAWTWRPLICGVAIVTMVVGAVLGLTQTDIKRMLAYSSIAHAGFLLIGVHRRSAPPARLGAVGHDVLPARLRLHDDRRVRRGHPGAGRRRRGDPPVALGRAGAALAGDRGGLEPFLLLAFAGIPLTGGFIGKFAVFRAAHRGGRAGRWSWSRCWPARWPAFSYLRVIVLMYFSPSRPPTARRSACPALPTTIVLAITAVATVAAGRPARGRCSTSPSRRLASSVDDEPRRVAPGSAPPAVRPSARGSPTEHSASALGDGSRARSRRRWPTAVGSEDPFVTEAAGHLIAAGGKRFRPLLALLAAQFGDPDAPEVVPARGGLRADPPGHAVPRRRDGRGRRAPGRAQRQRPLGQHASRSWPATSCSPGPPTSLADLGPEAVRHPGAHVRAAGHGQIRETVGAAPGDDPVAHYLDVLADKTGSLIATSARFGAGFAGVDAALVEALTAFGEEVGVAFQLSDDLLDIVSEDGASGQDARHRPARGRPDPAGAATRWPATTRAEARLRELVAGPITDDDEHAEALELLRSSASLARANEMLRDYADRARARLAGVPAGDVRDALSALCDYVVTRTS